jgi:hypothetical protein
MELNQFIQGLVTNGKVAVKGELIPFSNSDCSATVLLLEEYYKQDILEMPMVAPGFSADAALWAAQYLYTAIQLTVLRDAQEEIVEQQLKEFPGTITFEAVYSADLVLRYLPSLFNLAKGLAPSDILVKKMRKTAEDWPFSTVGIETENSNEEMILSHPSLKQAYADRIIAEKDKNRTKSEKIKEALLESMGNHASVIWPDM